MIWKAGLLAATLCALMAGAARANEYQITYTGEFTPTGASASVPFELVEQFFTTQAGSLMNSAYYSRDSGPNPDVYDFNGSFTIGGQTLTYGSYSFQATSTSLSLEDADDYPPIIGSLYLKASNSAGATAFGQDYHNATGGGTIDYDGVDLTNEDDPVPLHVHGSFVADEVDHITLAAAPEPGTWALMALGVGFAGAALRRRRGALSA